MFEKFPPPIRETIEAFFNESHFGATSDDHALDLAKELELQHPDLAFADSERIVRERSMSDRLYYARLVSQPLPSRPCIPLLPAASNSAFRSSVARPGLRRACHPAC